MDARSLAPCRKRPLVSYNWTTARQNQQNELCAQQRLRSACESAQSDYSLCCALNSKLRNQAFFMRTAKTLIRLGGCPDWSDSSLGAQAIFGFCHATAHIHVNSKDSGETADAQQGKERLTGGQLPMEENAPTPNVKWLVFIPALARLSLRCSPMW